MTEIPIVKKVDVFKDFFKDKTGAIVGSGRSLLGLTVDDFIGVDVVMTINYALAKIRKLPLTVPLFTMWKDSGFFNGKPEYCDFCKHICKKLIPQSPEILLSSEHDSKGCQPEYDNKYLFNTDDFNIPWDWPSVVSAIFIMQMFGVRTLKMMAFDSIVDGNTSTSQNGEFITREFDKGYLDQIAWTKSTLKTCKFFEIVFVTPGVKDNFVYVP